MFNYMHKRLKLFSFFAFLLVLSACTTGELVYQLPDGTLKTGCETEYTWAPSVDRYAVEYTLNYCAKKATAKGYKVIDESLLQLDISLPKAPKGKVWTFELAEEEYKAGRLSDKEYGYLIAAIDLKDI